MSRKMVFSIVTVVLLLTAATATAQPGPGRGMMGQGPILGPGGPTAQQPGPWAMQQNAPGPMGQPGQRGPRGMTQGRGMMGRGAPDAMMPGRGMQTRGGAGPMMRGSQMPGRGQAMQYRGGAGGRGWGRGAGIGRGGPGRGAGAPGITARGRGIQGRGFGQSFRGGPGRGPGGPGIAARGRGIQGRGFGQSFRGGPGRGLGGPGIAARGRGIQGRGFGQSLRGGRGYGLGAPGIGTRGRDVQGRGFGQGLRGGPGADIRGRGIPGGQLGPRQGIPNWQSRLGRGQGNQAWPNAERFQQFREKVQEMRERFLDRRRPEGSDKDEDKPATPQRDAGRRRPYGSGLGLGGFGPMMGGPGRGPLAGDDDDSTPPFRRFNRPIDDDERAQIIERWRERRGLDDDAAGPERGRMFERFGRGARGPGWQPPVDTPPQDQAPAPAPEPKPQAAEPNEQ